MHPQLVSPLLEVKQVTKTGEGGERKSGRDSELTYGGISPSNSMLCIEHLKDADIPWVVP